MKKEGESNLVTKDTTQMLRTVQRYVRYVQQQTIDDNII
jgi:hypothetical protein